MFRGVIDNQDGRLGGRRSTTVTDDRALCEFDNWVTCRVYVGISAMKRLEMVYCRDVHECSMKTLDELVDACLDCYRVLIDRVIRWLYTVEEKS